MWHFLENLTRRSLGLALLGLMALLVLSTPALGQTDFNIKAESPDLKSEFQRELDKWMLRAYEGDKDAQFKVGVLFANEQFGPPDHEQSSYWYTQAARQGHILAQYNLGHLYLTGNGVKRNERTAMQWWLKAAEQQHPLAQFNIGRAYYLGIGLEKDLPQAKLWFSRASQNNEPKSTEILKQLGWWDADEVAKVTQPTATNTTFDIPVDLSQTQTSNAKPNSNNASATEESADSKSTETAEPHNAIAVFTNPAVRNVLITIFDNAKALSVLEENAPWTVVTSPTGFPVWVNKNFIRIEGERGIVTGDSVNARSVPLITTGSVVGRLNKNETVEVIDDRGDWFRIRSPRRFKGWVKTSDLQTATSPKKVEPVVAKNNDSALQTTQPIVGRSDLVAGVANSLGVLLDDNAWLFSQDEQTYALQLASFKDPNLLKRFVTELPESSMDALRLYTTTSSDGEKWTYVVYGQYPDTDQAKAARDELKQQRAWIRRFGVLQQNRCIGWKKELPAPKELNEFCI